MPIVEVHWAFPLALRVLKGYWRQATNMTTDDQWEYKHLIECCCFFMHDEDEQKIESPIDHFLFKSLLISPTWAKYVFLKSLFGEESITAIDKFVVKSFKSLETLDLEKDYRTHHPDKYPTSGEASGEAQTPSTAPPDSCLLDSGSTEHIGANPDQPDTSSLLGQALLLKDQPLTLHDLVELETRLKASLVEMETRILGQVHELREHVMAATTTNDQMPAKQTN